MGREGAHMQITRRIFPTAAITAFAAFKATAQQDKTAEARAFADGMYKLLDRGNSAACISGFTPACAAR